MLVEPPACDVSTEPAAPTVMGKLKLYAVNAPRFWRVIVAPAAALVANPRVPATEVFKPNTGVAVYPGPAALPVALPRTVPADALLNANVKAGVVVAVATEVVNSGERPPALKLVTVPDVAGAAQTGFPEPSTVNTLPDEPVEPAESFRPAADDSRVNTPVIVPPASGKKPAAMAAVAIEPATNDVVPPTVRFVIEIDGVPVRPLATVAVAALPVQLPEEPVVLAALLGMSPLTKARNAAAPEPPDPGPAKT